MGEGQPFEIKLKGKKFKAGGTVSGTVTPTQDLSNARGVDISLAYREGTENFVHFEPYDSVTAGEGGLGKGEELPFELTLPPTALPSYDSKSAMVGWTVWVQADVKRGQDAKGFESVDVTPAPDPSEPHPSRAHLKKSLFKDTVRPIPSTGPATWEDENRGLARKLSKHSRWDVGLSVDQSVLRRGDKLVADVTIGEPSSDRKEMQVGVRCCDFKVVQVSGTGDDFSGPAVSGDTQALNKPAEGWIPLDGSLAEQTVEFTIPKAGPFSFGGEYVLYQWEVAVQEVPKEGRFYTGPDRALPLWVFP